MAYLRKFNLAQKFVENKSWKSNIEAIKRVLIQVGGSGTLIPVRKTNK